MDRPPPLGQAKRRIDGNEIGTCLMHCVQYVLVAERNARLSPQATKEAQTCRTARRTCEIDP